MPQNNNQTPFSKEEILLAIPLFNAIAKGDDATRKTAYNYLHLYPERVQRLTDEMLREHENRSGGLKTDWDAMLPAAVGPAQGTKSALSWAAAPAAGQLLEGIPMIGVPSSGKSPVKPMGTGQKALLSGLILQRILGGMSPGALEKGANMLAPVGQIIPQKTKEMLLRLLGDNPDKAFSTEEQALINLKYPSKISKPGGF